MNVASIYNNITAITESSHPLPTRMIVAYAVRLSSFPEWEPTTKMGELSALFVPWLKWLGA